MEFLIPVAIALFTFISRIINLVSIPIFTDEAIYIRWAQIGLADPAHRYISLTDGKQPLLTWLMYPFLPFFQDPLFAARLVSVCSGTLAAVGIYLVGKTLFGRRVGIFSAIFYIVSPFTMVYDRLALMDSLLAALAVWSLYLTIILVRSLRLDSALIYGATAGLGMLTKSSAAFFMYLLPFSLLLFDWKKKEKMRRLLKWAGLAALGALIAQVMYNSLRLSPWFYIINQKNHTFIQSFGQFFASPFSLLIPNLNGLLPMLIGYVTLPVFTLMIAGIAIGSKEKNSAILLLTSWFLIPFAALASFGIVLFPRFILFMTVPLFIIAAYVVVRFENILKHSLWKKIALWSVVFAYPVYQSVVLIVSPVYADIPRSDRNQLFEDWPSGYGVKEVVNYINQKAKDGRVVLGTEGTFGLNPAVYEIYFGTSGNVEMHGYWPVGEETIRELQEKAALSPTYIVFKESQKVPSEWPLTLIAKYRRGLGNSYLLFYEVMPIK